MLPPYTHTYVVSRGSHLVYPRQGKQLNAANPVLKIHLLWETIYL